MKHFQNPDVDSQALVRELKSLIERGALIESDLDKELTKKRKIAQKHPDNLVEMSSFLERAAGLICFYQIIFDFFGNSPGGKSAREEIFGYVDTLVKIIEGSSDTDDSNDGYLDNLLLSLKEFSKRLKGEEGEE